MPRRKRSETLAALQPVSRAPAAERPRETATVVACLCPICGHSIQDRAIKVGHITVEKRPYFETIDWDPDKPFGIAYPAGGRSSYKDWQHIGPEKAPELFAALKGRFLQAIKEWREKGWITAEDLEKGDG